MVEILFVTDMHGSQACFNTFLKAMSQPKGPDIGLIGGDIAPKRFGVALRNKQGYHITVDLQRNTQEEHDVSSEQYQPFAVNYADRGGYIHVAKNEAGHEKILSQAPDTSYSMRHLVVRGFVEQALAVSQQTQRPIFFSLGNDDPLCLDTTLERMKEGIRAENNIISVKGLTVASFGTVKPTPFNTFREQNEEEISESLQALFGGEMNQPWICNFHCPPSGTKISQSAFKDGGDQGEGGSTAIRQFIEARQPLVAFHGHIHDARGAEWVGKTLCVNPGSKFQDCVLQGARVKIEDGHVRSCVLTRENGSTFKVLERITVPKEGR